MPPTSRPAPPHPGGEYGNLRLDLLSGGDRLDNLPQWLAAMGSLPVVSLIPTRLDATARGQALAAVAALAGVVAVGLNAGQFARNQDLYGTPFGPDGEGAPHEIKYLNAAFGGPQLTSTSCATRPSRSPPRSVQ